MAFIPTASWSRLFEIINVPKTEVAQQQVDFWIGHGDSLADVGLRLYAETINIDPHWTAAVTKLLLTEIKAALGGCSSAQYFLKKHQDLYRKTARPFCSHCGYDCCCTLCIKRC